MSLCNPAEASGLTSWPPGTTASPWLPTGSSRGKAEASTVTKDHILMTLLSLVANDDKNNFHDKKALYSVLINVLKRDSQWEEEEKEEEEVEEKEEEEEASTSDMDWKSLKGDDQELIAHGNDDTLTRFKWDTDVRKKSQQPLKLGQQHKNNYNASKVDCGKGSIKKRSLQDMRGRLALAYLDTKAIPFQGLTKWRP